MTNFFNVFADVIRLLTFQGAQRRVRNDLPRREDQTIGVDTKTRPARDGGGGH